MSIKYTKELVEFKDKYQPCALMGASLTIAGLVNSSTILHGPPGCNTTAVHIRTDQVPDGTYVPVVATGFQPSDAVTGGKDILVRTLRDVARQMMMKVSRSEVIWILSSCTTSIIGDDIFGAAQKVMDETGIKIIALDTPGFKGSFSSGAEIVFNAILDNFVPKAEGKREGINLVGPYLMGSKNWPNDLVEMERLLKAADVKVNVILTHNTRFDQLPKISQAEANYLLTPEEMPDFKRKSEGLGIRIWGEDVVLPLGIANTEQWYLKVAEEFGNIEKAKAQMREDMDRVKRILRGNYNASWMLHLLSSKQAGVIGFAPFAAALARHLFFDLNVRPKVIGLLSSTKAPIESAKGLLKEMADYLDFEVLENPTYYEYGRKIKQAKVDFSIGQRQDKTLSEGLEIPQLSLGGFYFYNQFNFIPFPYFGILGSLNLLSEMSNLVENTFQEKEIWQCMSYHSRDERKTEILGISNEILDKTS